MEGDTNAEPWAFLMPDTDNLEDNSQQAARVNCRLEFLESEDSCGGLATPKGVSHLYFQTRIKELGRVQKPRQGGCKDVLPHMQEGWKD